MTKFCGWVGCAISDSWLDFGNEKEKKSTVSYLPDRVWMSATLRHAGLEWCNFDYNWGWQVAVPNSHKWHLKICRPVDLKWNELKALRYMRLWQRCAVSFGFFF